MTKNLNKMLAELEQQLEGANYVSNPDRLVLLSKQNALLRMKVHIEYTFEAFMDGECTEEQKKILEEFYHEIVGAE